MDHGRSGERKQPGAGTDVEHAVAGVQPCECDDLLAQAQEAGRVRELLQMFDTIVPATDSPPERTRPVTGPRLSTPAPQRKACRGRA